MPSDAGSKKYTLPFQLPRVRFARKSIHTRIIVCWQTKMANFSTVRKRRSILQRTSSWKSKLTVACECGLEKRLTTVCTSTCVLIHSWESKLTVACECGFEKRLTTVCTSTCVLIHSWESKLTVACECGLEKRLTTCIIAARGWVVWSV